MLFLHNSENEHEDWDFYNLTYRIKVYEIICPACETLLQKNIDKYGKYLCVIINDYDKEYDITYEKGKVENSKIYPDYDGRIEICGEIVQWFDINMYSKIYGDFCQEVHWKNNEVFFTNREGTKLISKLFDIYDKSDFALTLYSYSEYSD